MVREVGGGVPSLRNACVSSLSLSLSHLFQSQNRLLFNTTASGSVSSRLWRAGDRGVAGGRGAGGAGVGVGRFDAATTIDRRLGRAAPRRGTGQAGTPARPEVEGGHAGGAAGPGGRSVAIGGGGVRREESALRSL